MVTIEDLSLGDLIVVNKEATVIYIFAPLAGGILAGVFSALNDHIHKSIDDEYDPNGMTVI